MKEFIVNAINYDKKIVTTAIESGADYIIIPEDKEEEAKKLGRVNFIIADKKGNLTDDFVIVTIKNKQDEEKAAQLAKAGKKVIVRTTDWTIIPLENLIAQSENIYAEVKNADEASIAVGILEKGVKGVVLETEDLNEIKRVASVIKETTEKVELIRAKVTAIIPVGMGDRVAVDTTSLFKRGEGMLVGNSSAGMILVHAETEESPYVASRPFRVNAGAVHMYTRVPGGKTVYLCELEAGKEVMAYDIDGNGRAVVVGRAKIERRPMLLIEAEYNGKKLSAVLQNAETIRVVGGDGSLISVVDLKEGDEILGYVEEAGRHFGMKVEETILEK
ncbi:MAG TPA: 3-dehydroquinate synthase II [Persephonella sp.]|uniref:3-dehydroquinate synthase homolog n=1 Tax=Persephonella marina (strain DSM 14350 / EX-H1) TaxID=123214 RepID=DHQSH_PERMH|nr:MULTISPECIES: 3-dehydroquinate synthase II [Persephonella]C0QRE8.1 RecName: Full=3-dehydroquinate synthase homolog [Persephonella marina EX-H1]ACO03774.1 3-dehydroquinate synthase [Persephonella marina EX-H1]HCB68990.1 3-dehydroquinate synthase II [Persephonella sp.]